MGREWVPGRGIFHLPSLSVASAVPPPSPSPDPPPQDHGHPWRTASTAAALLPFGDIPLWSCSPSFPTGVLNGDVS